MWWLLSFPYVFLALTVAAAEIVPTKDHRTVKSHAFAQVSSSGDVAAQNVAYVDPPVAAVVPGAVEGTSAALLVRSVKRGPEKVQDESGSSRRISTEVTHTGRIHILEEKIGDTGVDMVQGDPEEDIDDDEDEQEEKDAEEEEKKAARRRRRKKKKEKKSHEWGSSGWYYDLPYWKRVFIWLGIVALFFSLVGLALVHLSAYRWNIEHIPGEDTQSSSDQRSVKKEAKAERTKYKDERGEKAKSKKEPEHSPSPRPYGQSPRAPSPRSPRLEEKDKLVMFDRDKLAENRPADKTTRGKSPRGVSPRSSPRGVSPRSGYY